MVERGMKIEEKKKETIRGHGLTAVAARTTACRASDGVPSSLFGFELQNPTGPGDDCRIVNGLPVAWLFQVLQIFVIFLGNSSSLFESKAKNKAQSAS